MRLAFRQKIKTILNIIIFLLASCYIIQLIQTSEIEINTTIKTNSQVLTNRIEKFRFMRTIEFKYKEKLESLKDDDIKSLSEYYHRDIALHWGGTHGLLPASKPPANVKCLDLLSSAYSARVTVIITYKNELLLLLYRTITTVVDRTPPHLLQEILLIDDGSDVDESKDISEYCRIVGIPVRIMRNPVSLGIASSRHKGIRQALGDVIVVLDSHMEVSEIWLEPLLEILKHKPRAVAIPVVHMMSEKDYEVQHLDVIQPYGIQMTSGYEMMQFYFTGPPKDNPTEPFLTSSLAGGALAARKDTLIDLYPASIVSSSWGIENNRLALRAWLCGDGLWVHPCSQILHVNGNDILLRRYMKNSIELIKKLKDESLAEITNSIEDPVEQRYFLKTIFADETHIDPVLFISKLMRKTFDYSKCPHNYDWYLENVHSSQHYKFYNTADFIHVGELQSEYLQTFCLAMAGNSLSTEAVCRKENVYFFDTHLFAFTKNGAIRAGDGSKQCLDAVSHKHDSAIIQYQCHELSLTEGQPLSPQRFTYNKETRQIIHTPSDRCVTLVREEEGLVRLRKCVREDGRQRWILHEPWWRRVAK